MGHIVCINPVLYAKVGLYFSYSNMINLMFINIAGYKPNW